MINEKGKLNRLAAETSPYLLQHAANPVDWYPWGVEAFDKARRENKPVFLSIGYSACHWCHVMAHESFENEEIASALNEGFISIKVDREERPDIDHVYMQAVQTLTGTGGWPLNVFLTPEGRPFFGGTYFPVEAKYGMPGFGYVLETVSRAFAETRDDIEQHAGELQEALSANQSVMESGMSGTEVLDKAFEKMVADFDSSQGGFGSAPKFPEPMALEFLLRTWFRKKDKNALKMVEFTLTKMSAGGIYDQVGGGFHRYSTDNMWLVPHFEKMLYDNALLAKLYLYLYQATAKELYRDVLCQTLDYVLREMKSEEGGFSSTQDADSEGIEGKYYTWEKQDFDKTVGDREAGMMSDYYSVTDRGNFEGSNILYIKDANKAPEATVLSRARFALAVERSRRVKPDRDEKVIASWNGMMISSLSEAGAALERKDYIVAAEVCARFIRDKMVEDGMLVHTYKDGRRGEQGFLEDYACVVQGLIDLYSATFRGEWLDLAVRLADRVLDLFTGNSDGILYDTQTSGEKLFIGVRNLVDGAIPSGSSAAARSFLYLARLTGDDRYSKVVEPSILSIYSQMASYPRGFANWLCALDFYLSENLEIAVICGSDAGEAGLTKQAICRRYLPNKVIAASCPGIAPARLSPPMLQGKPSAGEKTSVYICSGNTCNEPVTGSNGLSVLLNKIGGVG